MASIEMRYDGRWRIVFMWRGKRHRHSLGSLTEREAWACVARLEETARFVERGLLEIPPEADLGAFLVSGGKLKGKPVPESEFTLSDLLARYQAELLDGVKETSTRSTEKIHIAHLLRIIGPRTSVHSITSETMQEYVNSRSKEVGRGGRRVSHVTIRKELGTFASVWNRWAGPLKLVAGPSPTKGLTFTKGRGKPPFQTMEQIERQLARGGLSPQEIRDLWRSLFLTVGQVRELLAHVRSRAARPWVEVAFCLAAYTGARRSEILRSQVDDLDFEAGTVAIREKKRDRTRELTFRTVPMADELKAVLKEWFKDKHPGGRHTLLDEDGGLLTEQILTKAFRSTVEESLWRVLSGYHVLRHSFASNCALNGVDQRMTDDWMGHQTEEMRRRYRHLFPDQQQAAIRSVFG